jgi:ABC-type branched-subunit amino acid transport system permease subunit
VNRLRGLLPDWASPWALIGLVAAFVALYTVPVVLSLDPYTHGIVTQTFIFAAAALAWNWLGGYVGQISFGHAAMFGVGGFLAVRLQGSGLPFSLAWLLGGLAGGLYALSWGHPTLRLRGPYFAIATIGVGEATRLVATYWSDFTGGSSGISIPLGSAASKYDLYWYALYFLAIVVVLSYFLKRSRIGLGLFAIKEDVDAAGDVGVSASFYQDLVLFLSGVVVGVAGGIYASFWIRTIHLILAHGRHRWNRYHARPHHGGRNVRDRAGIPDRFLPGALSRSVRVAPRDRDPVRTVGFLGVDPEGRQDLGLSRPCGRRCRRLGVAVECINDVLPGG